MLPPGIPDHGKFFLGDPGNFGQPFDLLFEDIQGLVTETADDLFGSLGPHALNQAGTQVFLQGCSCGGFLFDGVGSAKLSAELGMYGPGTFKHHGSSCEHLGLVDSYSLLLMGIIKRQDPQHGPAIVRVVVGDPVHNSPQGFGDGAGG